MTFMFALRFAICFSLEFSVELLHEWDERQVGKCDGRKERNEDPGSDDGQRLLFGFRRYSNCFILK